MIALTALDPGIRLLEFYRFPNRNGQLLLTFQNNELGLEVLLVCYVALQCYINLPADALGYRGWIKPQWQRLKGIEERKMIVPICYRRLEPGYKKGRQKRRGGNLDKLGNCFVMQTHIEMFNFAWLVYYHGTKKYGTLKQSCDLFSYRIKGFVFDKGTDSRVLVVDGDDRIVIAFKGTNSVRNLRTDLKAFHMQAQRVLPTVLDEGDFECRETGVMKVLGSKEFEGAKLHKGFARAYMSISKGMLKMVKELYESEARPIYLTGHSLGGALASIAGFDLFLKMGLNGNQVFVSSFGSPRLGNSMFRKMYNEVIPHSWRIVIGPDVVTKLPKVGYQHVGKKVLLTAGGEMFIDPNALEMKHWHGDPSSLLYHRKASYLLAMKAWCKKQHSESWEPHFWPFPVSYDDERRFPSASRSGTASKTSSSSPGTSRTTRTNASERERRRGRKRRNIMMLDAMVDALDRKKQADVSEYAIANWARLTRRALLNEEFRLKMT